MPPALRKKNLPAEVVRLHDCKDGTKWRRWGTYLSERQWGTVREDYSANGDAWQYFTHEDAISRVYRWGEDGLLGMCDNRGLVNFAVALWNENDPYLKERLFGLTGPEGNHGEDVKEVYYYVDQTPTCSYARALYKYPQKRFPYEDLRAQARHAGRNDRETQIWDTKVFDENRYFDVQVEYAKADIEDILIRITVTNRGPEKAPVHVLPTIWLRNTWSWQLETKDNPDGAFWSEWARDSYAVIAGEQKHLGKRWLHVEGKPELLFTDNETNAKRLFGSKTSPAYAKDAFHSYVVDKDSSAVNPGKRGTKASAHFSVTLNPGESKVFRLRLSNARIDVPFEKTSGPTFEEIFQTRISEADAFYETVMPPSLSDEEKSVYRQAFAGLHWTKQYYFYDVDRWLRGDNAFPAPPLERKSGRNHEWKHLYNSEILSMPDKWEYPWYAAWDLAFHTVPLSLVDGEFAKAQLSLLTREWYMHPNGQLPAYEWSFGDVNPPVHAWAARRVYQIDSKNTGMPDLPFLETVFHKLMLNFTWWVNRKDAAGNNVFEGGFLGLDNIGVFDRSSAMPDGGQLEQADATSWMGMYCLNLLAIALELASKNEIYQDVANKFFEHFLYIADAMNGGTGAELWDEEDGFFYDVLHLPNGQQLRMKVRSMVGLIPLFAVETIDSEMLEHFPQFVRRMKWFLENRPELAVHAANLQKSGDRHILSLLSRERLVRVLERVLDEKEFLSDYGVRALSKVHKDHPFSITIAGITHKVGYEPAESQSGLFGGNSNWRGPIWFPVNFLLIESLQKYHRFYGDDLKVECPTGSGKWMNLWEVACEISRRLSSIFMRGENGQRPADGTFELAHKDPHFADYVTFHEYFNGDTGAGLGAKHQTGWTALVAKLLQQSPLWTSKENRADQFPSSFPKPIVDKPKENPRPR